MEAVSSRNIIKLLFLNFKSLILSPISSLVMFFIKLESLISKKYKDLSFKELTT